MNFVFHTVYRSQYSFRWYIFSNYSNSFLWKHIRLLFGRSVLENSGFQLYKGSLLRSICSGIGSEILTVRTPNCDVNTDFSLFKIRIKIPKEKQTIYLEIFCCIDTYSFDKSAFIDRDKISVQTKSWPVFTSKDISEFIKS